MLFIIKHLERLFILYLFTIHPDRYPFSLIKEIIDAVYRADIVARREFVDLVLKIFNIKRYDIMGIILAADYQKNPIMIKSNNITA